MHQFAIYVYQSNNWNSHKGQQGLRINGRPTQLSWHSSNANTAAMAAGQLGSWDATRDDMNVDTQIAEVMTFTTSLSDQAITAIEKQLSAKYNIGLENFETVCAECPAGSYSDSAAAPGCTYCSAGKHSTTGGATSSASCLECLPGSYSAAEGATSCSSCGSGQWSQAGSASCFSLEIQVLGEWEVMATSFGEGASQSVAYTTGIARGDGIERLEAWAAGVTEVVALGRVTSSGAGHGSFRFGAAADDEATHNNKTQARGVDPAAGHVESSAGFAPASSTGRDNSTIRARTPDLASYLAGSELQTLTQTWGAGVVWQFKYKIEHLEGSNEVGTQNTALTQDVQGPPCCLPGTFADPDSPHGNTPQQQAASPTRPAFPSQISTSCADTCCGANRRPVLAISSLRLQCRRVLKATRRPSSLSPLRTRCVSVDHQ